MLIPNTPMSHYQNRITPPYKFYPETDLYTYMVRLPETAATGNTGVKILDPLTMAVELPNLPGLVYALGQIEESDSGYRHWQLALVLTCKIDTKTVRQHFYGKHKVNIYVRMSTDALATLHYCIKKQSRADGPWEFSKQINTGRWITHELDMSLSAMRTWWDKYIEVHEQTHLEDGENL